MKNTPPLPTLAATLAVETVKYVASGRKQWPPDEIHQQTSLLFLLAEEEFPRRHKQASLDTQCLNVSLLGFAG
jgi:hypothetical protein